MKKTIIIYLSLFIGIVAYSQCTITGSFSQLANQTIKLVGFKGLNNYPIYSVKASDKGDFTIRFSNNNFGMGYLSANDNKPFIVVLANEGLQVKGETFSNPKTITILHGNENKQFEQFAQEHILREQALSAWVYLEKIYKLDSLFSVQKVPTQAIADEMQRIKTEDSLFLAGLKPDSYVNWYLPLRKLVSSVSTIAQYRTGEIPAAVAAFRKMDYTDNRLYHSGLLRDVIDSHFWLLENSGRSLDSVYVEMKKSIDCMVTNLMANDKQLNEITEYLFKLLEQRSLFQASEYLALKLLNEKSCTLNNDFSAQLESYRAMKKGNIAPDFAFASDLLAPGYLSPNLPRKLSAIKSKYVVVVFGASWCNACSEELANITQLYPKWKKNGFEVVFVSLDDDKQAFKNFTTKFPFISVSDYKKWESPIVKSYHVFATPTIYLLDEKREILLRPNSAKHVDSWIDWFLKSTAILEK